MARCPNCGQQTLRTEDWACQWCGFPLLNRPYKKIEKTYQQLKDEKLLEAGTFAAQPEVEEITEPEPVSEAEAEEVAEPEPEPAPKAEVEEVVEPEPAPKAEAEEAVEPEPEPAPKAEAKKAVEPKPKPAPKAEAKKAVEPKPKPAPKARAKKAATAAAKAAAKAEPEAVLEVTVNELGSAYATDGIAADEKFLNRVLKVTGIVGKIVVNRLNEHYYAILGSTEGSTLVDVQCTFNRHSADELKQLTGGQTATIQGRYEGFVTSMVLTDCVLAN